MKYDLDWKNTVILNLKFDLDWKNTWAVSIC